MQAHKLTPEVALNFILGGKAIFTIKNIETGGRFTYKVSVPRDTKPSEAKVFFVALLTGPDNGSDYRYIGCIKFTASNQPVFMHGIKSKINSSAPGVVVFAAVFNKMLVFGALASKLEIWHEGKCCRCARTLTVPESIASGIGPECAKK